jgi:hypothetical protein
MKKFRLENVKPVEQLVITSNKPDNKTKIDSNKSIAGESEK